MLRGYGPDMSREQRWAASGVVVLLGALWGAVALAGATVPWRHTGPPDDSGGLAWVFLLSVIALGITGLWLFVGLVTVRRVASGAWRWWPASTLSGLGAIWSLVAAASGTSGGPPWWVLLLGFQALALLAWSVLLWTPAPVAGAGEDGA